jgi:[protein-PII] uridylyltransferase
MRGRGWRTDKNVGNRVAPEQDRRLRIDHKRIDSHADEKLVVRAGHAERLEAFKGFLKLETRRLRTRHRFGLGGVEIAAGRAYLVDLVVRRACQTAGQQVGPAAGLAVVAIGGYGRRELCPHSDVDLLFLHDRRSERPAQALVEQMLMLLWDVGLTVGHSFRSVEDCVAMARRDLHSRNAMSEARLVTGSAPLFEGLESALDRAVYRSGRHTEGFVEEMRHEWRQRRERFGPVVCVLEPNVKEGAGGLRDQHTVGWLSRVKLGCRGFEGLLAQGLVSEAESVAAAQAYDFLSRVRNEAHFTTGRCTDLLALDLQPALAEQLGYRPRRGLLPSELLMRHYYRRANGLLATCEGILERLWGARPRRRFWRAKAFGRMGGFEVHGGRLQARPGGASGEADPYWLFDLFEAAQQAEVPLSTELSLLVRERLRLVDRRFRSSPRTGRELLRLLSRPGQVAAILRQMHDTGFLGRLLPEFGFITFLVQHDHYHRFTIDEHTLEAIAALDQAVTGREGPLLPFARVVQELEHPSTLYLGLLLHDIGKGRGGGHVAKGTQIAERVCRRLALSERETDDVVFLVRCHLMMSQISQRRDLTEDRAIDELVAEVGTLDRLNQLLLLTYADGSGIAPGAWNDWKAALLLDLYARARERLTGADHAPLDQPSRNLHERAVRELAADFPVSEVERHLALLPERYLKATGLERLRRHLRMVAELGDTNPILRWRSRGDERPDEVTVCTRDAPGLLARLAGTLTAHGLNIWSLDLFTRDDGVVLDTFRVSGIGRLGPVDPAVRQKVEEGLRGALEGRYDVDAAVSRWRAKVRPRRRARPPGRPGVSFDNQASATRTVVEVRADDQPGLVHRIAMTLAENGMAIHFAKIATEKSQALDVFYVTDAGGRKLTEAEMRTVERALLRALPADGSEGAGR